MPNQPNTLDSLLTPPAPQPRVRWATYSEAALPDNVRAFDDVDTTRKLIYSDALSALSKRFPIEDNDYRLELANAHYAGPQSFTMQQQKKALMRGRRLQTPIKGTWRLVNKADNAVLDEREDTVMQIPYLTHRGTILDGGNEYTVASQSRLRPGVYVRRQRTGAIEGHFNVKPGTGSPFRVNLEPETGVFKFTSGQSSTPIYPLMKALGVGDDQLEKAWGRELLTVNQNKTDAQAIKKIYTRIAGYKADQALSPDEQMAVIRETMPAFELDGDVVERTLGIRGAKGVTPEILLRTTAKMLGVSRGDEEADDRDAPRFSGIYGIEDLVSERIEKDAGKLARSLLFRTRRTKNLQRIQRNALSPYIESLIQGSGLALPLDETNPLNTLEQLHRITKLGVGGIASADSVTSEARDVNPGQLGFVDLIAGPENSNVGIDIRTSFRTFKGRDRKLYAEMFNPRTGKPEIISADTASDATIAFPSQNASGPDGSVPDYLYGIKGGKFAKIARDDVDYVVPSFGHMFSPNTNLNPMPTSVQAGRQFYGSKFWSQYLPQLHGEVPLVDSLMPDGKTTYSEHYGRTLGTVRADVAGTVTAVEDGMVTIMGDDKKKHTHELVKNFPFNRLSGLSYFPTVKVGARVEKGGMLAHSNFTDKDTGSLALGRNLKVAMIPFRGKSFEDAITLSEDAAMKLSTDRLYGYDADSKEGVEHGRNRYISAFPNQFTKEQLKNIGTGGFVTTGTVLRKGDPISLAVGPRMLSSADAQLGKLHKVLRNSLTDKAQLWEHDWPGTVVDVEETQHGARINVRTTPPVVVGDKLSTRYGLKGVVGKVIPKAEMPRDSVTNEPYDILMNPMGIQSRVAPNQLIEIALGKLAKATGKQVRLPQDAPDEGWAQWATDQLALSGVNEASDIFDPQSGKTIKNIGDGSAYFAAFHHLAEKKLSGVGSEGSFSVDEQPSRGGSEGAKRWCFTADQPIRLFGGEDTIGHIVEKRQAALVWSADDAGVWGWHRIVNWFARRGHIDELIRLSVSHLPRESTIGRKTIQHGYKVLEVTRAHEIYRPDGSKTRAGDLVPGDMVASYGYVPTADQLSILRGSLLGDGAICNLASDLDSFFHEMHSYKQTAYVRWKYEALHGIVTNRSLTSAKSGGYPGSPRRVAYLSTTRPDVVQPFKREFYSDGKKRLDNLNPADIDELAFATWFLDDGSITISKRNSPDGKIATNGFTTTEVDMLAERVSQLLGVKCNQRPADGTIGVPAQACFVVAGIVAKYVRVTAIPRSKKWLIKQVSSILAQNPKWFVGVDNACQIGTIPVQVTEVRPYVQCPTKVNKDGGVMLYDIEVDGVHRYCASDVLVSNSHMDVDAALSHGAYDVIKDVMTVRGTKSDGFWNALRSGRQLPEPEVPFIYNKFLNTLKAGGINVTEKGNITSIMPMTDDAVDKLSKGYIKGSATVDSKFEPMKDGLFDVGLTGGMAGQNWATIRLSEPVPNPVMEEPVRRVLGLKAQQMEDIVAGRETLNGKTGGDALKAALASIDIDKAVTDARTKALASRGAVRDNAIKSISYLTAAKQQGIHPSQWMISKVPVIPPMFRPISKMGDVALSADLNELYRDVIESSKAYSDLRGQVDDDSLADERLNVYAAVKAAYGLGEAITPEGQSRRLKGAIRQVIGHSAKHGMFQSKVISKPVGTVGRGVTTPDPNLDMDQVGIPADTAWKLYKDFVTRGLVRKGYPGVVASELIDKRAPEALDVLEREMAVRPVIMDRAPTLHKFNLMAFTPHITDGHAISVCPMVDKGFNMDHDGDQVNIHVPVSDKAVAQARDKMMPSKNLFSLQDLRRTSYSPSMEMTYGLFALTAKPSDKPLQRFKSEAEAIAAYRRGDLAANDQIEIG